MGFVIAWKVRNCSTLSHAVTHTHTHTHTHIYIYMYSIEGGSSRSHYVEESFWQRLWTCRLTDN